MLKKIISALTGSTIVALLGSCASISPINQSGDPHNRLSSFGEQLANRNWVTGFNKPTLQNPTIDGSEPDGGGTKMTDRTSYLGQEHRHSIAPVGDYDFSFIRATGPHVVRVKPKGGSVRVRIWQRASQLSGPSTLMKDVTVHSGSTFRTLVNLTSQKSFLVTRVEGTQAKRLIYDILYGSWE